MVIYQKPVLDFLDNYEFKLFLIENGLVRDINKDRNSYTIDESNLEEFFIKKQRFISNYKDFRKSQDTESQWRGMRYKMMKAIKRFHRSTEGKRLHRRMARFLSTREPMKGPISLGMQEASELINDIDSLVEGLTSFLNNYYHHTDELKELVILSEDVHEISETIISRLVIGEYTVNEDEVDFFKTIINKESLFEVLKEDLSLEQTKIDELWENASHAFLKFGTKNNPSYMEGVVNNIFQLIENKEN